ncbi:MULTISPECIES: flagellar hook-associated family protein [Pseudovibrio]|uniref:flagellar hook-associated family protein n=1 Tax=Stappiaceae TaxID=2821832 RepID=UPI002366D802|nr:MULTISPECIES: flagellar hook-associated family protein [Pseudovibrio]MDD7909001.1 flagellar hook-associated family protein [Pseudovibrio exalbescens]MDX5593678.1 flagellar hook-associated family protein [Pseudovibrio sp. SPO723]
MTLYNVSSLTMSSRMIKYIQDENNDLNRLNIENATGKHADMALSVGAQAGTAASLKNDFYYAERLDLSNSQTEMKLDVSYQAVDTIRNNAEAFRSQMIGVRDTGGAIITLSQLANTEMSSLTSVMNSSAGGVYLFGGENVSSGPMQEFEDAAKASIEAAFNTHFGFPITDGAQTSNITEADMQIFLDDVFNDEASATNEFSAANWTANWSGATDGVMSANIETGVDIETTLSANDQAFKELAKAYAMVGLIGTADLSPEVEAVVIENSVAAITTGIDGVNFIQTKIGARQQRLELAEKSLETRMTTLNIRINDIENVDPNEVAVRLRDTQDQLETNYAITARLNNLSLLNFLR